MKNDDMKNWVHFGAVRDWSTPEVHAATTKTAMSDSDSVFVCAWKSLKVKEQRGKKALRIRWFCAIIIHALLFVLFSTIKKCTLFVEWRWSSAVIVIVISCSNFFFVLFGFAFKCIVVLQCVFSIALGLLLLLDLCTHSRSRSHSYLTLQFHSSGIINFFFHTILTCTLLMCIPNGRTTTIKLKLWICFFFSLLFQSVCIVFFVSISFVLTLICVAQNNKCNWCWRSFPSRSFLSFSLSLTLFYEMKKKQK